MVVLFVPLALSSYRTKEISCTEYPNILLFLLIIAASDRLCANLKKEHKASGSQLAERLEQLLTELGQGAQVQADPVSAAEQAMRSMHLDPLVEAGVCLRRRGNLWMPGTSPMNVGQADARKN